jgi:hypothetical protein
MFNCNRQGESATIMGGAAEKRRQVDYLRIIHNTSTNGLTCTQEHVWASYQCRMSCTSSTATSSSRRT